MHFVEVTAVYLAGALIAAGVFTVLRRTIGPQQVDFAHVLTALLKGMLERLVLIVGLIQGIPQIVIAFGALKIGTRPHDDTRISNDYFLVGNLPSILIAFCDVAVIESLG